MKFIIGEVYGENAIIVVTGNGSTEIRIISGFTEKYNHSKTLVYPRDIIGVSTGLKSAINALTKLVHILTNRRYMLIIDKEHVKSINEIILELRKHGFQINERRELINNALVLKLTFGEKEIVLYVSISGFTREGRIEENLSKLIRVKYNEDVAPIKVRSWMRKQKIREIDLIRESTNEELNESFPTLNKVIQEILKDP